MNPSKWLLNRRRWKLRVLLAEKEARLQSVAKTIASAEDYPIYLADKLEALNGEVAALKKELEMLEALS